MFLGSMQKQRGNTSVTILILVIAGMFIFACYNPNKVPGAVRDKLPESKQELGKGNNLPDVRGETYAIQVVSTTDKKWANTVANGFIAEDLPARIDEIPTPEKHTTFYKVRIGLYESRTKATKVLNKVKGYRGFGDSFITTLHTE